MDEFWKWCSLQDKKDEKSKQVSEVGLVAGKLDGNDWGETGLPLGEMLDVSTTPVTDKQTSCYKLDLV